MNRLSLAFFAAALLIMSVAAFALVVRTGAVAAPWEPVPASAEVAPAPEGPGASARL